MITIENKNLINIILMNFKNSELMYVQTSALLYIFSKEIFKHDLSFFNDFLSVNGNIDERYKFGILSTKCELYQEHNNGFKKENALCYKYIGRDDRSLIYRSVITTDIAGRNLYVEGKYLGIENYQTENGLKYNDTPKRKIISGIMLGDYLKEMPLEKQKSILTVFFNWFFSTYQSDTDKKSLKGTVADCHLNNFLISDGKFVFIDFDVVYKGDILKDLCLWYACKWGTHPLYSFFTELYELQKYEPNNCPSHPFVMKNKNREKAGVLNKDLFDKYFTEKGLSPKIDNASLSF